MTNDVSTEAIVKANYKLQAISRGIKMLNTKKSFEEKEDAWNMILYNLAQIGKTLKKLSENPKTKSIADAALHQQSNDPLLSFMYQARNAEDHGVKPYQTNRQQGGVKISGKDGNLIVDEMNVGGFHFKNGVFINVESAVFISSEDPSSIPLELKGAASFDGSPAIVTVIDHTITLNPITSRGTVIQVPDTHLGKPIIASTVIFAELSLEFYSEVINRMSNIINV